VHAEFKVPGGKLVTVDLEAEGEKITRAQLSGDFFLEPDDLLEVMNRALIGLPLNAQNDYIVARIEAVLPADAVLFGVDPAAIATVVRRALTRATGFADYTWELLGPEPLEPLTHMALDQVLTDQVASGARGPTLRIWEWAKPAVVIGSFQSVKNEVDMDNAKRYGLEVTRRISGGGAMFMELGTAITYSLYAPSSLVAGMSFQDSYAFLDDWVINALQRLGIDAHYRPLNDIHSPTGKIGGAAQKRLGSGAVLHHVTMAYDMDGDRMVDVLRIGREKMSDKGVQSANKRVDPLRSHTGMSRVAIMDHLAATFTDLYTVTPSRLTEDERAAAQHLVTTKFATDEWFYRVP
jgi:lipoate-protein ligase A